MAQIGGIIVMQLFGINVFLAGLHLRMSVGLDENAPTEAPSNGAVRGLEGLPRLELSRD